jgi:hypothetical protein
MKILLLIPAILVSASIVQGAHAWNLIVGIRGAQVGHGNISVNLKGQNGYTDSKNVPALYLSSGGGVAVFNVPENEITSGSTYQVCAHSDGNALKTCETFTHGNGEDDVGLVLKKDG